MQECKEFAQADALNANVEKNNVLQRESSWDCAVKRQIEDVLETTKSQDYLDYPALLRDAVRYVMPECRDIRTVEHFIRHKILFDFAREPLDIVSINWLEDCGPCVNKEGRYEWKDEHNEWRWLQR